MTDAPLQRVLDVCCGGAHTRSARCDGSKENSPSGDSEEQIDRLVAAGRILERYEDPRMRPLSEENFRFYDSARKEIAAAKRRAPEPEAVPHKDFGRWNFERTDNGFRICEGLHEKSSPCEWLYYVRSTSGEPSGWQPIETAPKDSRVLLLIPSAAEDWSGHRVVAGEWCPDKYSKKPRPYWSNDKERLFGVAWARSNQPIMWMPIPLPSPSTKETKHGG